MPDKRSADFFGSEYEELPEQITFIDDDDLGFDAEEMKRQIPRPEPLPAPAEYTPQRVGQWNPATAGGRKRRGEKRELPFSPLRLAFGVLAIGVMASVGWLVYRMLQIVVDSGI